VYIRKVELSLLSDLLATSPTDQAYQLSATG